MFDPHHPYRYEVYTTDVTSDGTANTALRLLGTTAHRTKAMTLYYQTRNRKRIKVYDPETPNDMGYWLSNNDLAILMRAIDDHYQNLLQELKRYDRRYFGVQYA